MRQEDYPKDQQPYSVEKIACIEEQECKNALQLTYDNCIQSSNQHKVKNVTCFFEFRILHAHIFLLMCSLRSATRIKLSNTWKYAQEPAVKLLVAGLENCVSGLLHTRIQPDTSMGQWYNGYGAGVSIDSALSCNDSGQVVHTHLPLLPISIIWYWLKYGDAQRLGR